MRSLLIISCFLSMSSTAFSTEKNFVGVFLQKNKLTTPASNWGDCDSKKEFVAETSSCVSQIENTLEIKSAANVVENPVGLFSVKIVNHGAGRSVCELELKMKIEGEKLVLAQRPKNASKEYSLSVKRTKSGVQVIEKLGMDEVASDSSPGCTAGSFANGNGSEYAEQYPNHLTQISDK